MYYNLTYFMAVVLGYVWLLISYFVKNIFISCLCKTSITLLTVKCLLIDLLRHLLRTLCGPVNWLHLPFAKYVLPVLLQKLGVVVVVWGGGLTMLDDALLQ